MTKRINPDLVVTKNEVLFSWIINDVLERIKVPRAMIDQAQGRPLCDGAAWALIEDRMGEIAAARADGASLQFKHGAHKTNLDWIKLLGPRNR